MPNAGLQPTLVYGGNIANVPGGFLMRREPFFHFVSDGVIEFYGGDGKNNVLIYRSDWGRDIHGTAAPASAVGRVGDYYWRVQADGTTTLYGPKTGGGWGSGVTISGGTSPPPPPQPPVTLAGVDSGETTGAGWLAYENAACVTVPALDGEYCVPAFDADSDPVSLGASAFRAAFGCVAAASVGAANGVASLDATGRVPSGQLPALALTDVYEVATQAAQLALVAQEGDVAVRSDENKSYIHNGGTAGTMADWTLLRTPTDTVVSVAGRTGAISLTTADVSEGSNLYFTNERAQDAVGAALTDGSTVRWIYDDYNNIISAEVKAGTVDGTHLAASGVTAGSYGGAGAVGSFTVDAAGRVTAAAAVPISASSIETGTLGAGRLPGALPAGALQASSTGITLGSLTGQTNSATGVFVYIPGLELTLAAGTWLLTVSGRVDLYAGTNSYAEYRVQQYTAGTATYGTTYGQDLAAFRFAADLVAVPSVARVVTLASATTVRALGARWYSGAGSTQTTAFGATRLIATPQPS